MRFNPDIHHRRSIRLQQFDYSLEGAYFVTICVHARECLFGAVENGQVVLNDIGNIVKPAWDELPERFPRIRLGEYVVMPNHFHGIIVNENVGAPLAGALPMMNADPSTRAGARPAPTLGDIVGTFKSITTVKYIEWQRSVYGCSRPRLWQRNYWEHVVRNDADLDRVRKYIINNPVEWEADEENPNRRQVDMSGVL